MAYLPLDPAINTLLNVIADKRQPHIDRKRDERWCAAYNVLARTLEYDRPGKHILEFGHADLRMTAKLSHRRKMAKLRNHLTRVGHKYRSPAITRELP